MIRRVTEHRRKPDAEKQTMDDYNANKASMHNKALNAHKTHN